MLEIQRSHAAIVECHASPLALQSMPAMPRVHVCRVAPDELLLVAPPSLGDEVLRRATAHLTSAEPETLVLDQSDGWAVFSLRGDDVMEPLRKLAVFPFPEARPAFVQGAVAGGPAKLLLLPGVVHLLVPFPLRDHLERRLRDVCDAARTRIAHGEVAFASAGEPLPPLPPPIAGASTS